MTSDRWFWVIAQYTIAAGTWEGRKTMKMRAVIAVALALTLGMAGEAMARRGVPLQNYDSVPIVRADNAKLTGEEAVKGSNEAAKFADFAVLSADYLSIPAKQIESLKAVATYIGGKLVYQDAFFASPPTNR